MENGLPITCKKKSRNGVVLKTRHSRFLLFRRHLYYCQNSPILFQRSGVGRAHKKAINTVSYLLCKKIKKGV